MKRSLIHSSAQASMASRDMESVVIVYTYMTIRIEPYLAAVGVARLDNFGQV